MKSFLAVIICLIAIPALSEKYQSNAKIDALFRDAQTEGTFVVFDSHKSSFIAHNPIRADERFVPASTFKIPNSLIGLSVGAAENVDEVLPFGGNQQPIKAWEKDMSLRDAIKISNVPVYQELARRIGLEQMQQHVSQLKYGNCEIGSSVDNFWLKGPLRISAVEQTQFLIQLAEGELPYSARSQISVHEILELENGNDWTLYGKTGWANGIGWWVGWVEKKDHMYSFALNIDMTDVKDAPKRIQLGKDSLKTLGIID